MIMFFVKLATFWHQSNVLWMQYGSFWIFDTIKSIKINRKQKDNDVFQDRRSRRIFSKCNMICKRRNFSYTITLTASTYLEIEINRLCIARDPRMYLMYHSMLSMLTVTSGHKFIKEVLVAWQVNGTTHRTVVHDLIQIKLHLYPCNVL